MVKGEIGMEKVIEFVFRAAPRLYRAAEKLNERIERVAANPFLGSGMEQFERVSYLCECKRHLVNIKVMKDVIEKALDKSDVALIKLAFVHGLSYEQIAAMSKVSKSTVFRRLKAAVAAAHNAVSFLDEELALVANICENGKPEEIVGLCGVNGTKRTASR